MATTRARMRSSTMVCSTVLVEAAESIAPMPARNSMGSASQSEVAKENAISAAPAKPQVMGIRLSRPRTEGFIAR